MEKRIYGLECEMCGTVYNGPINKAKNHCPRCEKEILKTKKQKAIFKSQNRIQKQNDGWIGEDDK